MSAPRLPLSSRPAFLPDEIARREFATVFRGYDPAEVRTFLNQLAEQHGESADLIADLQRSLIETEQRVKNPVLDEETVTKILGEQTAQVLRSAREAANDARIKAEEEVSAQLREAHEVTTRMRQEAEAFAAERTQEAARQADAIASEAAQAADYMRKTAEDDIASIRATVEAELTALREKIEAEIADEQTHAHAQARELIETARAEAQGLVSRTQERQEELLDGLIRKRKIALAQVEELRAGRQRLLQAYKMVRGTLDEITDELQRVEGEARGAAETAGLRSAQANEIQASDLDSVIELERYTLNDDVSGRVIDLVSRSPFEDDDDVDDDINEALSLVSSHLNDDDDDDDEAEMLPYDGPAASQNGHGNGNVSTLQRDEIVVEVIEDGEDEVEPGRASVSSGLIIGESAGSINNSQMDRGLKLRRDAAVGKFRSQAVRRLKRALQDEQDALVTRLRTNNGETVQALVGSTEDQAATYQRALVKLFREVARTGVTSVEGSTGVERGLVDRTGTVAARGLAMEMVQDLRDQLQPVLQAILDSSTPLDPSELQARVADPFNIVKGEYLEQLVDDRIGGVFDQGVAFARQR